MAAVSRIRTATVTLNVADFVEVEYAVTYSPNDQRDNCGPELHQVVATVLYVSGEGHDLTAPAMREGPRGTGRHHSHAAAWESVFWRLIDADDVRDGVFESLADAALCDPDN